MQPLVAAEKLGVGVHQLVLVGYKAVVVGSAVLVQLLRKAAAETLRRLTTHLLLSKAN